MAYRKIKAEADRSGRSLREVADELIIGILDGKIN